jgi:nucleotide-binding universal stress UspA family protein
MQRLLVSTDFSTRSDRALRRGSLLARQLSAELILVHVVDDDQPRRLVEVAQAEATVLLHELARTVSEIEGIVCESRVVHGDPFQKIVDIAGDLAVDLVILGPHRRQILRDIFLGTTAERTIRQSKQPVIMANGMPVGGYHSILIATDFTDSSLMAAKAAKALGLFEHAQIIVLHVLEAPDLSLVLRASLTMDEIEDRIAENEEGANKKLDEFLHKVEVVATRCVVKPEVSTAMTIKSCAQRAKADLVVVGTRRRTGVEKWLLGSVAENVLSSADVDVLVIPSFATC